MVLFLKKKQTKTKNSVAIIRGFDCFDIFKEKKMKLHYYKYISLQLIFSLKYNFFRA